MSMHCKSYHSHIRKWSGNVCAHRIFRGSLRVLHCFNRSCARLTIFFVEWNVYAFFRYLRAIVYFIDSYHAHDGIGSRSGKILEGELRSDRNIRQGRKYFSSFWRFPFNNFQLYMASILSNERGKLQFALQMAGHSTNGSCRPAAVVF